MTNIICVLYDDPVSGYPPSYARDSVPTIEQYHGGQNTPSPEDIDFTPGELLGCVSGELGLREFVEGRGHNLIVTSDKEGPDSVLDRELPEAEIVISQPFWPAYLTAERIAKAPKLRLAVTAGIGSDHVDIDAAIENGITVAEVTFSNSISVSEHVVMMILALVPPHPKPRPAPPPQPTNPYRGAGGGRAGCGVAAMRETTGGGGEGTHPPQKARRTTKGGRRERTPGSGGGGGKLRSPTPTNPGRGATRGEEGRARRRGVGLGGVGVWEGVASATAAAMSTGLRFVFDVDLASDQLVCERGDDGCEADGRSVRSIAIGTRECSISR